MTTRCTLQAEVSCKQQNKRERGRNEKSEKVQGEEWETVVGRTRKKREKWAQEGQEKGDAGVDKEVLDAEIQIFVKADGAKTGAMDFSLDAAVRDVARRVLRSGSEDQDMYVVSDGREMWIRSLLQALN